MKLERRRTGRKNQTTTKLWSVRVIQCFLIHSSIADSPLTGLEASFAFGSVNYNLHLNAFKQRDQLSSYSVGTQQQSTIAKQEEQISSAWDQFLFYFLCVRPIIPFCSFSTPIHFPNRSRIKKKWYVRVSQYFFSPLSFRVTDSNTVCFSFKFMRGRYG